MELQDGSAVQICNVGTALSQGELVMRHIVLQVSINSVRVWDQDGQRCKFVRHDNYVLQAGRMMTTASGC